MNILTEPIVTEIKHKEYATPKMLIERIGRTCYKSNSEYTDETAQKFFTQLVTNGHFAMLEHAIFTFNVSNRYWAKIVDSSPNSVIGLMNDLKYFNVTRNESRILLSGSLRAFNECKNPFVSGLLLSVRPDYIYSGNISKTIINNVGVNYDEDTFPIYNLNLFDDLTKEEIFNHIYMTLDIKCDRGTTHELVRHRNCAFAQESSRYCNYSKDRFGESITYLGLPRTAIRNATQQETLKEVFSNVEALYLTLVNDGMPCELARAILPTALKSEIVMTANLKEWKHIIDLRYKETTGKVHPHMKAVATKIKEFYDNKVVSLLS